MASVYDSSNGPATKKKKRNDDSINRLNANTSREQSQADLARQRLQDLNTASPVLSIELDHHQSSSDIIDPSSSPSLLEAVIFPLCPENFLSSCFRQKALHVAAGNQRRVERIAGEHLFGLDPESILRETSSESVFVWLSQKEPNGSSSSSSLIQSVEIPDPATALSLHRAGHATYCRAPPELEQVLVSRMLAETGLGCGQYDPTGERSNVLGRGEVEVFLGTREHVTDWHYDFQENFTVQLSGSKRWTLQQGTVKYPLRGCTPHYASPESVESQLKAARLTRPNFEFGEPSTATNARGNQDTVLVQAGDVLYFPAGMWHKVETVEPGVSINISLMATTYAALTCRALEHLLLQRNGWNETMVNSNDGGALHTLQKLLQELPSVIKEFEQGGGAASILPPALLLPPQFKVIQEGEEQQQGDEDDHADNCDVDKEGIEHDSNSSVNMEATNCDSSEIVDVCGFECPQGWSPDPPGLRDQYRIVKNPLALLTPMKDISHYYSGDHHVENGLPQDKTYVLNTNYAGNEMHESSVRVILRDSTSERLLKDYADPSKIRFIPEKVPPCMLFYGFFQWQRIK